MIMSFNSVCREQRLYSWKIQHLPLPTNHQLLPLLLIYRIQMRMLKGPQEHHQSERKCTTSLNCFLEEMTFDGWKYCEGEKNVAVCSYDRRSALINLELLGLTVNLGDFWAPGLIITQRTLFFAALGRRNGAKIFSVLNDPSAAVVVIRNRSKEEQWGR